MTTYLSIPKRIGLGIMIFIGLLVNVSPVTYALSAEQKRVFDSGTYYFDTEAFSGTGCDSSILVGSVNAEKIFNFFLGQGLTPPQAAGAYGNIMHESNGDPENIQNPAGRTKDPSSLTSRDQGWGLIQWTPGTKIIDIAKSQGVTSPIYELATQLEIIWNHMEGTSPTGTVNMLEGYRQITDYKEATAYFEDTVEGAGVVALGSRQEQARIGLSLYGSNSSEGLSSDTTTCSTDSSGEVVGDYSLPVDKRWYISNKEWFTKPHHDYPAADIPVPLNTPVYSVTAGKIIRAPVGGNCGNGVIVDAGNGLQLLYCHGVDGGSVAGAKNGNTVEAGQMIMRAGYTGRVEPAGEAGTHLHLEIRVSGKSVCPQGLLVGIAEGSIPDIQSLISSGCTN